jgi:acyl carrier protein phosphodiesterase
MISDFVKGKKKFDFSPVIQKGIALHRAIDDFTDFHPATYNAKSYFRKRIPALFRSFVDIVYDHFLANDKGNLQITRNWNHSPRLPMLHCKAAVRSFRLSFYSYYPICESKTGCIITAYEKV